VKEALVTREPAAWGAAKGVAQALSRLLDPQVIHDPSLHDAVATWVVDQWHAHGRYTVADGRAWTQETLASALEAAYPTPAHPALAPATLTPAPVPQGPGGALWTPSAPDALEAGGRGDLEAASDAQGRFLGALAWTPWGPTPGGRQARLAAFQTALLDGEARAWTAWARAFVAGYGPYVSDRGPSGPKGPFDPKGPLDPQGCLDPRGPSGPSGPSVWALIHRLEGPVQEAAWRDLLQAYAHALTRRRQVASSQTWLALPRALLPSGASSPERLGARSGGRAWRDRAPAWGPRGPFAGMVDPRAPGSGALGRGPYGIYTRLWAYVAVQERRAWEARASRVRGDGADRRGLGPQAASPFEPLRALDAGLEAWWAAKGWVPMPEALLRVLAQGAPSALAPDGGDTDGAERASGGPTRDAPRAFDALRLDALKGLPKPQGHGGTRPRSPSRRPARSKAVEALLTLRHSTYRGAYGFGGVPPKAKTPSRGSEVSRGGTPKGSKAPKALKGPKGRGTPKA